MLEGTPLPVIALPLLVVVGILRANAGVPWRRAALEVALADYALFVIAMILFPVIVEADIRMNRGDLLANPGWWFSAVPFQTIGDLLSRTSPTQAIRQIGGNLGLLIPLGFLLPALSRRMRGWRAFALTALCVSVGIEGMQFVERATGLAVRSVDIDDVMLNALGALLGFLLFRASMAFISRPDDPAEEAATTVVAADRLPNPRVPRTSYAWWAAP